MRRQNVLDQALRFSGLRSGGFIETDESRALLDEIGAQIVGRERPLEVARRRRFRLPHSRRGLVLGSLTGLLAVGGAAAATVKIVASITVGAPGFCSTELNTTAGIQFPSGDQAWKNWALLESVGPKPGTTLHELCDTPAGKHVADDGYPGRFGIPTVYEKETFTAAAFCAWTAEWLRARSDGDMAAESQAAGAIADVEQWPSTQQVEQTGADVGANQRTWFGLVARAVQADDVDVVTSTLKWKDHGTTIPANECFIYVPPANSENGTVAVQLP